MSASDVPPIIGVSEAMKRAVALVERFAPTGLAILLIGATGTGKELFARHIHHRSRRRGELVDVNCGALPRDMVESLLFGHRRGAFTGAVESTVGHLQRADGGTLFLDELLHLPPEGQVKLLRALENGDVQPLGEGSKRRVDLRVVAAAQEDARARVATGAFRRDLFQRLAGIVIRLPPLAERPEDVMPLASYFASLEGRLIEHGGARMLRDHSWPGNVRELRLAVERAGLLVTNGTLPREAIGEAIALGVLGEVERPNGAGRDQERGELFAACEANAWQAERTAAALGIHRVTLFRRLKRCGLSLRVLERESSATVALP